MNNRSKPSILCILDGWGHCDNAQDNAIKQANTPHYDRFLKKYAHCLVGTDGPHVGLPEGQMGNSEVGHMNIGAGRIALPEFGRIDQMIGDGCLDKISQFKDFMDNLKKSGGVCHLLGLLSTGGVHSHQDQIAHLANLIAAQGIVVHIHAFSDGRDMPPQSAKECFDLFIQKLKYDHIYISTVSGRFYAMDRDTKWDRIAPAYDAMVSAKGHHFKDVFSVLAHFYEQGIYDEFIESSVIGDYQGMKDGDGLLMANFRADRVREILAALVDKDFNDFARKQTIDFSAKLGMVKYSSDLEENMDVLVRPLPYPDGLSETLSKRGLKQLKIAETEKYAHVTFFFNGGLEAPFDGEDRKLIKSPNVRTYDLCPEMSAGQITDHVCDVIQNGIYDFITINFANPDMVGHTGILSAAIKAIEVVDHALGRIEAALGKTGGVMLVTADHGNAELMKDPVTQMPHTQHTTFKVPAILLDPCGYYPNMEMIDGKLADIAPTMLWLTNQEIPDIMTGNCLVKEK